LVWVEVQVRVDKDGTEPGAFLCGKEWERISLVLHAFMHMPLCKWGLCASGMLQNANWYLVTNRLPIT
jgi:hypothetical protein